MIVCVLLFYSLPSEEDSIRAKSIDKFMFRMMMVGYGETGEMAQLLRVMAEDPGSVPSTHVAAHNTL